MYFPQNVLENLKLIHLVSKHLLHIMLCIAFVGAGKVNKSRNEWEAVG